MNARRIRILIADEHPVSPAGRTAVLSTAPDRQAVAEGPSGSRYARLNVRDRTGAVRAAARRGFIPAA